MKHISFLDDKWTHKASMGDPTSGNTVKWTGQLVCVNLSERSIIIALDAHEANLVVRGLSEVMLSQSARYISERLQRLSFEVDHQSDYIYFDWSGVLSEEPSEGNNNHELSTWARCGREARDFVEDEEYFEAQGREKEELCEEAEDQRVEAHRNRGAKLKAEIRERDSTEQLQPQGREPYDEGDEEIRVMLDPGMY